MGVILIIIYYIYNNLICGGWLLIFYVANVANVANVIQVHFAAFCGRFSRAKAVPLHRISKRAEIANK